MSNTWFRFREFLIRQDRSAMKVGTDGVLLGAWADCSHCATAMDVGTGTGLIALMIAQRNPEIRITAIEIDEAAASQAQENIIASPWADRINVVRGDFMEYSPDSGLTFDLIVCNPPFFTRSLKNPDTLRATARHDEGLPLALLIGKACSLLSAEGSIALILPADRADEVLGVAIKNGLYLNRRLHVRGNPGAPVKRVLLQWGRTEGIEDVSELIIETGVRGVYTEDYRRLTEEFYL